MEKLTLPLGVDEFHRVEINEDKNWETDFVPWLEGLEKDDIGVQDGFFVATFSKSIRKVNAENESDFVETVARGLQAVVIQRLKYFDQATIMHYGVQSLVEDDKLKRFKEETADINEYKKETCCSSILREKGLQALMNHLDGFLHSKKVKVHSAKKQTFASSSRVIVEEIGCQLKKKYSKLKECTQSFDWNSNKPQPPIRCEEAQCADNSDSQVSESDDDDEDAEQGKKRKRISKTSNANLLLYGFGNCDDLEGLKITENFQMTRLFNLLWLLPHKIPGFHSSYFFYGTVHSVFPVHVEDGLTLSANVVYAGQPKLWVMIPPWARSLLEFHLKNCGSFVAYMHCSNFLGHKTLVPTIKCLLEFSIPFKIVVQHPFDLVVLYPNTAHYGFNLGRNFAEAINFAIPSWVPWGAMASKCSCLGKEIHIPIKPFLAVFRPDLLDNLEHGRAITTPSYVRGMQLLASEVERLDKSQSIIAKNMEVDEDKERGQVQDLSSPSTDTTSHTLKKIKFAKNCAIEEKEDGTNGQVQDVSRPSTETKSCLLKKCKYMSDSKKDMVKHVRNTHKPLLNDNSFMEQIDKLFT